MGLAQKKLLGSLWRRKARKIANRTQHLITAVSEHAIELDDGAMLVDKAWFFEHFAPLISDRCPCGGLYVGGKCSWCGGV